MRNTGGSSEETAKVVELPQPLGLKKGQRSNSSGHFREGVEDLLEYKLRTL